MQIITSTIDFTLRCIEGSLDICIVLVRRSLILSGKASTSFQSHCSGSASIVYTCWDSGYTSIIIPAGFRVQVNELWKIRFPFPLFYYFFRQVLSRTRSLVTLSGGCGLTLSDGQRWESNHKYSETQSASFAAT
jgi:hypothetical protein